MVRRVHYYYLFFQRVEARSLTCTGPEPGTDTVDSSRDGAAGDAAQVAALQAELERIKQTRAEYTSARVAAEVQKAHEQHAVVEAELRAQLAAITAAAVRHHQPMVRRP